MVPHEGFVWKSQKSAQKSAKLDFSKSCEYYFAKLGILLLKQQHRNPESALLDMVDVGEYTHQHGRNLNNADSAFLCCCCGNRMLKFAKYYSKVSEKSNFAIFWEIFRLFHTNS